MSNIRDIVQGRSPDSVVLRSRGVDVSAGDLANVTVTPRFATQSKPARLALHIVSPQDLIKVLYACDGWADTMLLLDPHLADDLVQSLSEEAGCDIIVSDNAEISGAVLPDELISQTALQSGREQAERFTQPTRWIMTTSGTTGVPKMIEHSLASLSRTVHPWSGKGDQPIWGLIYDPTRFAGLQVVLQAVLGGGVLVTSDTSDLTLEERLQAYVDGGCTHLSATPTFWRRVLMHPASDQLKLKQITLGGEIADQATLDALKARFPQTHVTHIYASTEVGVGFSVKDGREGFPVSFLQDGVSGIELKIEDGRLRIRKRNLVGEASSTSEYVDTQDNVVIEGDRVKFLGRDTGVINVGGAKVYPEVVERVITAMPEVLLARVSSKRNPFSGQVVVAEVVPTDGAMNGKELQSHIIRHCREVLPQEAVPALVRIVDELATNSAGKLTRV